MREPPSRARRDEQRPVDAPADRRAIEAVLRADRPAPDEVLAALALLPGLRAESSSCTPSRCWSVSAPSSSTSRRGHTCPPSWAGHGVLLTVAGLGAVAGAVLAARIARAVGRTRAVLGSGLVMGVSGLLIPLTDQGAGLALFAVGAGTVAFSITVTNVTAVSLRQVLCPDHLLGRMNATTRFLGWATLPLGGLVGGALGTAVGLRATLWLAAVGLLLSWLWLLLSPACRARGLPGGADAPTSPVSGRPAGEQGGR